MLEDMAKSTWFALVSGVASVLGLLITLYTLRIKDKPSSRLRTVEWEKNIRISLGVGIMIFSGLQFYNQTPPPGFLPFRWVYDFLHGERGSKWDEGDYNVSAWAKGKYVDVVVKRIEVTSENTILTIKSKVNEQGRQLIDNRLEEEKSTGNPSLSAPPPKNSNSSVPPPTGNSIIDSTLFSPGKVEPDYNKDHPYWNDIMNFRIILGLTSVQHLREWDFSAIHQGEGTGKIIYPSILGDSGDLLIAGPDSGFLDIFGPGQHRVPHDLRGNGTLIWPFIFLLGSYLFLRGKFLCPFCAFKNRVIDEVSALHSQEDSELNGILNGRSYEEISSDEKLRFDRRRNLFRKIESAILTSMTGEPVAPTQTTED